MNTVDQSLIQEELCPICKEKVDPDYCTLLCAIHKICRSCLVSWVKFLMRDLDSNIALDITCAVCKWITPSPTIAKLLPELGLHSTMEGYEVYYERALERDYEQAFLNMSK